MTTPTFLEKCLSGEMEPTAIDDFVAAWHEGAGEGLGLPEFLGLEQADYARWVLEPNALHAIVQEHRGGAAAERRPDRTA